MATIDILGVPHAYDLTPPPPNSSLPVLVFIHGWLLSRRYWQPLINILSPSYQCLIYDLRGFGDSLYESIAKKSHQSTQSHPKHLLEQSYSLAAYAQDLGVLLRKLKINRAWLIGHSLGGSISLWGADLFPNQVEGVICLNSGGGIYLKEEFERFRAAGEQIVKLRPRWLVNLPGIDLLFTRVTVANPVPLSWGRQRVIDFVVADSEAALGALMDSTTEAEVNMLPQVVARIKQPAYFLAGAQDKVMESRYVCHLASFHQLFQDCGHNFIEIPNCGHMSMVEQTDLVASNINKILSNHQN